MNPGKHFSVDEINRLKRAAPQGMAPMNKKPRASYNPSRPDARSTHVHPQGPHSVPRRPSTTEPKRFRTSLFNIPVQNQSSQIHSQSNNTASLPLLIRPWHDRRESNFFPGDLIFVKKDARGRLRTAQDLVGMNRTLKSFESGQDAQAARTKADQFINEYNFYGIYRNKTNVENQGPAAGSSYHRDELTRGTNQQQLINVDVFGRSKIGNMFCVGGQQGNHVNRGDHLGLVLYRWASGAMIHTRFYPTLNGVHPVPLMSAQQPFEPYVIRRIPLGICSFSTRNVTWTDSIVLEEDKNRQLPQLELLML
tara:strand:+ start:6413 stop:7336 length:924 start_codon:yes stop_codon:yes gene_type:complete